MPEQFPIIEIPLNAPEADEYLGTKEKFWFRYQNKPCLYKKARQNTGEDWAEKIAAHLGDLLMLPHADYELAVFNGESGIISDSFLPENGILTLGNEILAPRVPNYPQNYRDLSQHTIDLSENSKAILFKALSQNFDICVKTQLQGFEIVSDSLEAEKSTPNF